MVTNTNPECRRFLIVLRRKLKVPKNDRIDKRYKPYLAPDDNYYDAHCGYCAEVDYLLKKYGNKEVSENGN